MKILLIILSSVFFFSLSVAGERPTFRIPMTVGIQTLDPSEAEDFVSIRILTNLGEGLVHLDRNLKPIPGLAESWSVSNDKCEYTFKIKKTIWSDGSSLTAENFVAGFEHSFSPTTVAKIAFPLIELVKGASTYKKGQIHDFAQVGIKALDERTLKITLIHPSSYFLTLLALPVSFPHTGSKADFKIAVGTPTIGPYVLTTQRTDKFYLEPNLHSLHPAQNNLEFRAVQEQAAALALYERGELEFLDRIPSQEFKRLQNSIDLIKSPWLSTYYLGFNLTKPPFDQIQARKAVVQSINRKETVSLLQDPQSPGSSLVPSPFPTSQMQFGPTFEPTHARKLWAEVKNPPKSLELYFDKQDKNILIASHIQKEILDSTGVTLNLRAMEWKSYLQYLKTGPAFFRFAWLAAFPDPLSHLSVFYSSSPNNYTGYRNKEYDHLLDQIASSPAGATRTNLIKKAQDKLITEDVVIMPLFHYVQYLLINRRWQGIEVTPMGVLYFDQAHLKSSP